MASYTGDSNIDDFFKVFLFAADNSDVEWALHRGRDNTYTIGTSHRTQGVDSYSVLIGRDEIPIASIHSHPNVITHKDETLPIKRINGIYKELYFGTLNYK